MRVKYFHTYHFGKDIVNNLYNNIHTQYIPFDFFLLHFVAENNLLLFVTGLLFL